MSVVSHDVVCSVDNTLNGDIISFTVNLDIIIILFIKSRKPGQLMISFMFYSSSGELVGKTKMKEFGLDQQ